MAVLQEPKSSGQGPGYIAENVDVVLVSEHATLLAAADFFKNIRP